MKKQITPRPKRKINEQGQSPAPKPKPMAQLFEPTGEKQVFNKIFQYQADMLKFQEAQLQALQEIARLLASK